MVSNGHGNGHGNGSERAKFAAMLQDAIGKIKGMYKSQHSVFAMIKVADVMLMEASIQTLSGRAMETRNALLKACAAITVALEEIVDQCEE